MANRIADFLTPYKVRVIDTLEPPVVSATVEGITGETRLIYAASYTTIVGQTTLSEPVTVSNGNASLTGFNKVWLAVGSVPETVKKVRYWKNLWQRITVDIREVSTTYDLGDYIIIQANSDVRYECTTAGATSAYAASGWSTTIGDTVADGSVVWTVVSNIQDNWELLGEVDPDPGQVYDTGQATQGALYAVPVTNDSGRPNVIAIGAKPGTLVQRQNWEDLQAILFNSVQDLGDIIHRNGDIREGCKEFFKSGTTWGFTPGKIYFMGRYVSVQEGEITLVGTGEEKVGVTLAPRYSSSDDDIVQRASNDEGVPARYSNAGPDWLYFEFTWVKDTDGMMVLHEFLDNVPKKVVLTPQRTEIETFVADKFRDLAGDFVVDKFPMDISDHTDTTKLNLNIKRGKAYPNGFKTVIEGSRTIAFDRARETRSVGNGTLSGFYIQGATNDWNYWTPNTAVTLGTIIVPPIQTGYRYVCSGVSLDAMSGDVIPVFSETPGETTNDNHVVWTTMADDYDLNALTLTVKVGEGATRTVTFSSDNLTAAQVATAVEAAINATVNLVDCTSDTAILQIRALEAKPITLGGTAIAKLGWVAGTSQQTGTRVYRVGSTFVKDVSDISYQSEFVLTVSRSTSSTSDPLGDGLSAIIGASDSAANCHDGIYDYEINIDFFEDKDNNAISFAEISGTPPTPGNYYYVKCRKNYNPVKGTRQLVYVYNAELTKGSEDSIEDLVYSTNMRRVLNGNAVTATGSPKHVLSILRVTNNEDHTTSDYSGYSLVSNTDGYGHTTSQISWDGAGDAQPLAGSTYYVSFEMWLHVLEGDYVSADSYDMYDRIDTYEGFFLRDCIDFRTTTSTLPTYNYNTVLDYTHYLPRIDKVMLDDFGNFYLIKGTPAQTPTIPNDQVGRMSLAILSIMPYTYSSKGVSITSIEPVVIKQSSMRSILNRLDQLEYWKAVTDLEEEVAGGTVSEDAVGLYTNALTGLGKFDLNFRATPRVGSIDGVNVLHTAALDINRQCLLLSATPEMKELSLNDSDSYGVRRVGNTLMLDYEPEVFLEQPYASESVNCAIDYEYDSYRGTISVFPPMDVFIDKEQLPTINIDFENNLQPLVTALVDQGALRLNETVWGNWNTSYSDAPFNQYYNRPGGGWDMDVSGPEWQYEGSPYSGYTSYADYMFDMYYDQWVGAFGYGNRFDWGWGYTAGYTEQRRWRDGVERSLIPGTQKESLGSAVVDLSMSGKVRTTYDDGSPFVVQIDAMNLVPNQEHAISIGGIVVNFTHDTAPVSGTARGTAGNSGHYYNGYSTVKTDNDGRLTGKFTMPSGLTAGNLAISVFLYSDPVYSNAAAYFSSAGYVQKTRETTIGMPSFSYCSQALHEESTRRVYDNYYDPLAQTFVVYDEIRYISEVGVFFRTKHSTLPIRMELRGTTNGEPNSTILAQSIVEASAVTTSEDATAETIFELDTVLGYNKDTEFAIALFPALNNTDYSVWTAKVGGVDVKTGVVITSQTNDGVLFHSPNSRVWEPMTKQDMKFKLYRCNFEEDAAFVFNNVTGIDASAFVMAVEEFAAPGTDIRWLYRPYWTESSPEDNGWIPFYPNVDTYLETTLKRVDLKGVVTSFGGSYQLMNPLSGIVLMKHKPSDWAVCPNENFPDALNLPNTVKCYVSLDTDTTGPVGVGVGRSVTPYFSFDDGVTLVEIDQDPDVTPTSSSGAYSKFTFSTPPQATIISSANGTASGPIVCTATNHKFKENAKVIITGVTGDDNANGTFVIRDVTDNTFSLYNVDTKAPIVGLGVGSGGTVKMAEFNKLRPFVHLETANTVRTPRIMNLSFIASKV